MTAAQDGRATESPAEAARFALSATPSSASHLAIVRCRLLGSCQRSGAPAPASLHRVCMGVVTLIGALRKHGLKKGIAALCIGGGEATAMALELA